MKIQNHNKKKMMMMMMMMNKKQKKILLLKIQIFLIVVNHIKFIIIEKETVEEPKSKLKTISKIVVASLRKL